MTFPRTITINNETGATTKKTCYRTTSGYMITEVNSTDDGAISNMYNVPMLPPEFFNEIERAALTSELKALAARKTKEAKEASEAMQKCAGLTADAKYTNIDLSLHGWGNRASFMAMRYNVQGWVIVHQSHQTNAIKIEGSELDSEILDRLLWIVDVDPAKVTTQSVTV